MSEKLLREIYELEAMIAKIDALLADARARLLELREAEAFLHRIKPRKAYRIFANMVMLEIPVDEAEKLVRDEAGLLEARVRKLEDEREKLARRLEELKRSLSLQH